MAEILSAKAGKLNLGDAFLIAGAKTISEKFLASLIGDASLFSGSIKLVGAVMSNKLVGGKFGDILGTALAVDGTEDIVSNFMSGNKLSLMSSNARSDSVATI